MILDKQFEHNFIPTYGLFLCPTNEDGTEICLPIHKQEHLFLVQSKIKGDTFATHLHRGMTLERFQEIVHELFHVLISLENSSHKLYHTDLHCSNIIMHTGTDGEEHPLLLDFELCSFEVVDTTKKPVQPHRYRLNSIEHIYCKHEHVLSGAHDLILLFSNSLAYKNNKAIQEYTLDILQRVCSEFLVTRGKSLQVSQSFFSESTKHRWIFSILTEEEEKINDVKEREYVHQYNLGVMRKMTYHYLFTTYL
jgi:hypothetical protein